MQWRAVFQRSGKTPEEMLRLKIAVKDGEIDEAAIFRKKLLRSFSPAALLVDNCWRLVQLNVANSRIKQPKVCCQQPTQTLSTKCFPTMQCVLHVR